MSTYASQSNVENYIEGWVTDDPFALERLIQRAEKDIDRLVVPLDYGTSPTQVINVMGPVSGTLSVTWNGINPQTIVEPYNVSGAQLQTDLQAITDIGAGNVTVLGNNPYTLVWTYQWSQKFANGFIPLLSVVASAPTTTTSVVEVEARRINPSIDLNRNQAISLSNATCAQVEYRVTMGESFFIKGQYASVKGPDFATNGILPYIAPKALRELAATGLSFRSGRAVAGYGRRRVSIGWPNY